VVPLSGMDAFHPDDEFELVKEEEEHEDGGCKRGITTGVVEGGNRGPSFFIDPYIKYENIIII
jgi:hypothetical protein